MRRLRPAATLPLQCRPGADCCIEQALLTHTCVRSAIKHCLVPELGSTLLTRQLPLPSTQSSLDFTALGLELVGVLAFGPLPQDGHQRWGAAQQDQRSTEREGWMVSGGITGTWRTERCREREP